MKIAIIGGGWVGCHLAYKLKNRHTVTIFEQNNKLFQESSYHNQNRLHVGFHYARNHKTRELCKDTFNKFINDYGFGIETVEKNCYCVPEKTSILDYKSYLKIFNDFKYQEIILNLLNVEGCINTDEKYINFKKCSEFFNQQLLDNIVHQQIAINDIDQLSEQFDLVIDCTNNHLGLIQDQNNFFELTLTLIYEKIKDIDFDALTMVDGNLFSIYPYTENKYTVTDVTLSIIDTFKTVQELSTYKNTIDDKFIQERVKLFEDKILKYYPRFTNNFKYNSYFLATKSKHVSESSSRFPVIVKNNNVISCFTGKIQGVYIIEEYINSIINETV